MTNKYKLSPSEIDQLKSNVAEQDASQIKIDVATQQAKNDTLSEEQMDNMVEEYNKEEKYGDSDARTFVERGLSSATFGLSDQALTKSGIVSKTDLAERARRNPTAALAGEVAGVVGPAVMSGGSSLLAKGAAAGVKGAAKVALKGEMLTSKILNKVIRDTGKKSLAKEVLRKSITKGAGSAVEGSLYGAGKLISEEALGNADFNAENLINFAGSGAVMGGIAGGAFGTAQAILPVIGKGAKKGLEFTTRPIKGAFDKVKSSQELVGIPAAARANMAPEVAKNMPVVLTDIIRKSGSGWKKFLSSKDSVFSATKSHLDELGNQLGNTLDDVTSKRPDILPTKATLADRIITKLDDLKLREFAGPDGKILKTAKPKIKKINKIISQFQDDLADTSQVSAKYVNDLKSKYQKLSKWERRGQLPLEEDVNREISRAIREEMLSMADNAGGALGSQLRKELLDYGTTATILHHYGKHINKQSAKQFVSFRDLFAGSVIGDIAGSMGTGIGGAALIKGTESFLKSDLKRKLIILSDIEKANQLMNAKIGSSVKNFLSSKKPSVANIAARTLPNSKFAYDYTGLKAKKPKDKKDAFKNLQTNLQEFSDPNKIHQMGNISDAAPRTTEHMYMVLQNAVNFLQDKMPKEASANPFSHVFAKWSPSTQEVAKFEKYLSAVENPASVLEDLESGMLSREGVEALQAVYPNIYKRVQELTLQKIAENPDKIDYQQKLKLGILLDVPTDASLTPSNIAALQSHFSEAQTSQAGGVSNISPGKAADMDMAQSSATTTQVTEKGRA